MKFQSGWFGACLIVMALLGTVLAGFVASIEKENQPVSKWDYITDVSGLMDHSQAPEYIDYNPSTNYTGYTNGTGTVVYSPSSGVNNYRYVVEAGTDEAITPNITVTNSSSYPADYGPFKDTQSFVNITWNGSNPPFAGDSLITNTYDSGVPVGFTTLSNILPSATGYERFTIDLTYTGSYPVLFYNGDWAYTSTNPGVPGVPSIDVYSATFTDSSMPDRLVINTIAMYVEAYKNGNLVWSEVASKVGIHVSVC